MRIVSILFILIISNSVFSQTYNAAGGTIPDDGSTTLYPLDVTGLSPNVLNADFGLLEVCVDIIHTWDDDLELALVAPDGAMITLSYRNGGNGDDYSITCLNSTADTPITNGEPPYDGLFAPEGNLGLANNGQNGNGTWNLFIEDHYPGADTGEVLGWSISFGADAETPFFFESSNLPLIFVNTNGQNIEDDPAVIAEIGIVDNGEGNLNYITDPFNDFDGFGKIEFRGQSSQSFNKKNYAVETSDELGNDIDASLLGLPLEEDWIFHGPHSDKTHMRNNLSMKLSREMGWYASRTRYFELFINNDYKGLYLLMEKIKRDDNRLDLAKLNIEDIDGDEVTGGYILKIDKGDNGGWESDYNIVNTNQPIYFQHVYPKSEDLQPEQFNYIQNFIREFEDALAAPDYTNNLGKHYTEYADVQSFVDFFIVNELSKNVDAYRISTYLHKEKNTKSGKIIMGPVWDFNLGWFNANYCEGDDSSGWIYEEYCDDGNPFWWDAFATEPQFQQLLKCRWENLRENILSQSILHNYIDSMALVLDESQTRNFDRWDILGDYVWPNPSTPDTYQGEIDNLKDWITNRLTWMDNSISQIQSEDISATLDVTECESYTSPSGNFTWTESGTYSDTVLNDVACDSSFVINLSIIDLDNSVTGTETSFIANLQDATYQWLDCDNNFGAIVGATEQSLSPSSDGNYAVQISQNNCTITSDCYTFLTVGVEENAFLSSVSVYPNPTQKNVFVDLKKDYQIVHVNIRNIMGQSISTFTFESTNHLNFEIDSANGLYFIEIETSEGDVGVFKILKR
ncbi:MAG: subtilisin-like proprotein convertase family protein [Maribacter sp.]|jgi:subtilisin-like proprotein convertase family protein